MSKTILWILNGGIIGAFVSPFRKEPIKNAPSLLAKYSKKKTLLVKK